LHAEAIAAAAAANDELRALQEVVTMEAGGEAELELGLTSGLDTCKGLTDLGGLGL
jgi:hypothetical protein